MTRARVTGDARARHFGSHGHTNNNIPELAQIGHKCLQNSSDTFRKLDLKRAVGSIFFGYLVESGDASASLCLGYF